MQALLKEQPSPADIEETDLAALIARHIATDGGCDTAVPSLFLYRCSGPYDSTSSIQEPALCLVAQGRKVITLGSDDYTYDPEHYLLVSVGLPIGARVVEASEERPYLGLRLDLSPAIIADVLLGIPTRSPSRIRPALGLSVGRLDNSLRDAVVRLIRLLDRPEHIAMLAPLILREILYLLLIGPEGERLQDIARMSGQTYRIARVIERLRRDFDQPLRIGAIAREMGMSVSSLYHQFKGVTAMSPLQYQKRLRLQEARRLMLSEDLDAAGACFRVGYESPSQFNREYRRLFGAPPGQDAARLRERAPFESS